ncbi:hypothetical protein RFI_06440 [Reticulomyxa filosa]|uniref:Uncharacterized protein n=1 Tax=Reticulomyxa filosa TaxID=46433 RepID=X6NXE8_RETFI|nr:hypothetical protein RFI_06440 [Reticulomyxa filosa]|eukprot:ETO30681.1 hypothetical protein RFI_06440 [Reticulomyxa filosa]
MTNKWQNFVNIINQSEKKQERNTYNEGIGMVFGMPDKKNMLESICKNEKKIQVLASNEIFTNQKQFE